MKTPAGNVFVCRCSHVSLSLSLSLSLSHTHTHTHSLSLCGLLLHNHSRKARDPSQPLLSHALCWTGNCGFFLRIFADFLAFKRYDYIGPTLRAPLSGTFLQTLPDLVTPLKRHSLSPRSCPATRSAASERFGY